MICHPELSHLEEEADSHNPSEVRHMCKDSDLPC